MKRTYLRIFSAAMAAGLVFASSAPVLAHDETSTETNQATISERVAKRKAENRTVLTTVQQKRLQSRCKNAQTLLKVTIEKANKVHTNRDKIHTDLLGKLANLETKLAAAGVNTTELKAQIADLTTKIETFQADSTAYIEAAQDTAALDCQADPAGFKASLEASRASLKKLQADAVAIRTTLAQQIKPGLAASKTELETKKAE
jgi:hypothetical protein